jgi:integrase
MPAITISKRTVDQAVPGTHPTTGKAVDAFLWDTGMKGFGLKVTPAGAKVYLVQYRIGGRGTPTKRVTIGQHGAMGENGKSWTPETARRKATAILGAVADGKDPAAEKRAKRQPVAEPDTFAKLAERFLEHGRTKRGGRELRASTREEYRRALIDYAADLGKRSVRSIRRGDIADLIETVAAERGTTSAMRTRAALSRFFGWLIARDKVDANPVTGTEGYAVERRKRVMTDDELHVIWQATAERIDDFNMIVRLCLWTGTRRSEPGGMADSELGHVETGGFSGEVWTVPGTRTKNHRPLALPLPRQARAALATWDRIEGKDKLFGRVRTEKKDTGFQGWSDAKADLDERIARLRAEQRIGRELREGEDTSDEDALQPWILHDLRRTVETRMAPLGIRKEIVNRVLNHAQGPITETYDLYDYLPEKAAALQAWADKLEQVVEPREDNVVPMAARA